MDDDIQAWLAALPLNTRVEVGGEQVYLNVYGSGAELGAVLATSASQEQVMAALRNGFPSAMEFHAGLAYTPEGNGLALTRWLPGVRSWASARGPLEDLLTQLAAWRGWVEAPKPASPAPFLSRHEKQMRSLLLAKKS